VFYYFNIERKLLPSKSI